MGQRIYKIELEENVDIISYSNMTHVYREIWLFFDSSVFVELTNFFVDKKEIIRPSSEFKDFITYLSTNNFNIHPISLVEAAREKAALGRFNERRWIDHLYAVLLAQCVDIDSSSLETSSHWTISRKREDKILEQYAYLYQAKSLDQLAVHIFRNILGMAELNLKHIIQLNEKYTTPFLKAIREANNLKKSKYETLKIFFDQISSLPYCPKIVDYCIRLILEKPSRDSLINGALRKIGNELENSSWDIAIFEQSQLGNFLEPFQNIKPYGIFYSCDNNQYYYARLGRPLIVNILNNYSRVYYPDLRFEKLDSKSFQLIKDYFNPRFPENADDFKDQLINRVKEDLRKAGDLRGSDIFIQSLEKIDFSELPVYQFFSNANLKKD